MQKVPKPPIYQLARLCGCSFPELADYTELEACAWHCLCYFFPLPLSLPLLSTPPSWQAHHLPDMNQICHLQIPSGSFLTSQQSPASSSSSSLLPDVSDTSLSYPSHLGGFSPTPAFQNCHHKHLPRPGFQGGIENSELWSEVLGDDYLDPPVTPALVSLLKKLFCHQPSAQPSDCVCEILPISTPARKWSINFNFPQLHDGPRSQPALNTSAETPLKKPEPMKPEPNLQLFWSSSMFHPFLHGLSSSICNLCLQPPGSECLPYLAQWDCSFHQGLWVIQCEQGMREPGRWWTLWNFPREQQQTEGGEKHKGRKGHVLHEGPLVYGSCSSLTQQTPSTFGKDMHSQITLFFPPCIGNFATAVLPWWQHR